MQNKRDLILDKVDLLLAELAERRSGGPSFRVLHRHRKAKLTRSPSTEIVSVLLIYRGQEYWLPLPSSLLILFDYLGHSRTPQTASQIAAGIRTSPFYVAHMTGARDNDKHWRRFPRSVVKVYIERLRLAIGLALKEADLALDVRRVLLSQRTVTNEIGYRLAARCEWMRTDIHCSAIEHLS